MWKIVLKIGMVFFAAGFLASCATTPDIRLSAADMTMKLEKSAYRVSTVAVSRDGKYVAAGDVNGDVAVWDMQNGRMHWKANGHKIFGTGMMEEWVLSAAFTPDGKSLLTGGGNNIVRVWDVETGKIKRNLEGHEGNLVLGTAIILSIDVSSDGKKAVTGGGDHTARLWDIESGALIKTFTASEGGFLHFGPRFGGVRADLSSDGKHTLTGGGDGTLRLWDNQTGVELLKIEACFFVVDSVVLSKDGTQAFSAGLIDWSSVNIRFWNLKTGNMIWEIESGGVNSLSVSEDGKYLLSGGAGGVYKLWDVGSGKLLKSYRGSNFGGALGRGDAAVFHPNGKWIVTKGMDASVRIKDMDTDEEVALLVGFINDEWMIITSEGYYNSSEKGAKYLSTEVGGTSYSVESFYDVFYRPDIVMAKLRGEDISGLVTITMEDAIKTPPPSVEFAAVPKDTDQSKVKVCYKAKSTGGGVGEVRLFHNGKLVQSDGYYKDVAKSTTEKAKLLAMNSKAIYEDMKRGIAIKEKMDISPIASKSKGDTFEDCGEIDAISGENEVSVTAFNSNNTVQSPMKTISFNSKIPSVEPHLYILSVGIDQYKDSSVNLKYAVKDANDIKGKILMQASTLYKPQNIHYELLTDKDATKTNILNRVNELSSKIKAADSFILFVAGHGVLLQNQYFMLTHEYDGGLSDNILISANEIVEMSKKIKSLSQLLIFDTCHAGGVDYIVSGLYDARMSVLAKKMGLHIYASASSLQEAMDGYNGNGLFSHALLDGLNNNKGADKNSDGKVSLVELGGHSKMTTVEISKKIGHTQIPLIINFGKDNAVYSLGR